MKDFASIVIPVYNQLHYTKACLESLLRDHERIPYEILVVDNGSTDGTEEYLEAKSRELDRTKDRIITIANKTNLGVAPAWNQGLKAATSAYIAILNNDIVVPNGWFRSLMWALDFHQLDLISPFAATGPMTYELEERAEKFTRRNLGKLWKCEYDFCAILMPRRTFEKVGLFDEGYLVGGYEDNDYCYRMRKAKMPYGVTGASFIHHFGSSTLGEFKKRGDKHAAHNCQHFKDKWGVDPSAGVGTLRAKLRRSYRRFKLRWDRM